MQFVTTGVTTDSQQQHTVQLKVKRWPRVQDSRNLYSAYQLNYLIKAISVKNSHEKCINSITRGQPTTTSK